jgi:hypothetical protein
MIGPNESKSKGKPLLQIRHLRIEAMKSIIDSNEVSRFTAFAFWKRSLQVINV